MVIVSIIGVIMIVIVGVKITVMGGEEKNKRFQKNWTGCYWFTYRLGFIRYFIQYQSGSGSI